ncbi:hypothetical protein ACFQJD_19075 [Haloplanus sp. GCM10025708]|uniref:DUF7261 family protein n=1 Tax=Haloplanus sp. GCM10025708 TaxID=3252679 RepID=UPI00360EFC19
MTDSPPTCADWTTPALDGVDYAVAFNDTAADRFAETHCPGGELREFEPCAATGGVVAQSRANQTVVVAAAFDVTARSARGHASATYVYWGVNGSVASTHVPGVHGRVVNAGVDPRSTVAPGPAERTAFQRSGPSRRRRSARHEMDYISEETRKWG